MYSKQQASLVRKNFWEAAGHYLAPMPSADAQKVNWINYKTHVKHISFRLYADDRIASVAIEISDPDLRKRNSYYNFILDLKSELEGSWVWKAEAGGNVSSISAHLGAVNIYNRQTWPEIISFFKANLIRLDAFWVKYKEVLKMMD